MNRTETRRYPAGYLETSRAVLETAINTANAYRSWRGCNQIPALSIDERFAVLPVLTKNDLRAHFPKGFIPPGMDLDTALASGEVELVQTSGTTTDAVTNIWFQPWWDGSERASWKLNKGTAALGLGNHREAILSSPRCVGFICEKGYLSMDQRRSDRLLFLNEKLDPTAWTPELFERMLDELALFQPVLLEANPSLLSIMCRYAARSGAKVYQPGAIVLTYENPSLIHLRHIQSVFSCPVISSYGSTETGYVFMQCEAGRLHQNTDYCRVDFQPLKPEHGGPSVGRILVTTFHNPWRVLLRFDVGDLARVSESPCPCGRTMGYTLDAIEGRWVNVTLTAEGRLITQRMADLVIGAVPGIAQYQLNQTMKSSYLVRYVKDEGDWPDTKRLLTDALRELYGSSINLNIQQVSTIAPEQSGKYRLTRADFDINIEEYLA
jgi:phenylacetate-CoA ligase